MADDSTAVKDQLLVAARRFDRHEAAATCSTLVAQVRATDDVFPLKDAKQCLAALRDARFFDLAQTLAEAFIDAGHGDTLQIQRQYAQALLDQGHYPAALLVLERVLKLSDADPGENREARGLLGRAHKQLYVDGKTALTERAASHLSTAIRWYGDVYAADPNDRDRLWHGINAVALLMRAQRDGITVPTSGDPRQMAEAIRACVAHLTDPTPWDMATAGEACVALGRGDEAVDWMQRYVAAGNLTAFALAGTLRQLTEVWSLDLQHRIGRVVIPWMQSWLLEKVGGQVELGQGDLQQGERTPVAESRATYEALLSNANVVSLDWYKLGLERCRAVARIEDIDGVDGDVGMGTGFVLREQDLRGSGTRSFVLTNAHVVSPDDRGALRPDRARVSFKALAPSGPVQRQVKKLMWTSPPEELDATLLEIDPLDIEVLPFPLAQQPPLRNVEARVYVIGHPRGGGLSFSLNDNLLLDYDDRHLHYRAPTEGGSSGSPVFNQKWQLVALHHAGGKDVPRLNGAPGHYAANEGIWIQAIRTAIAEKLSA